MNTSEAAERFGRTRESVLAQARKGKIPGAKQVLAPGRGSWEIPDTPEAHAALANPPKVGRPRGIKNKPKAAPTETPNTTE